MEIKSEDIEAFLSQQPLGRADSFGQIFQGHIPTSDSYGLEEMDVAIRESQPCNGEKARDLEMQFKNELKLCDFQHRNIIRLIGFSETEEHFYLVYEMIQAKPLSEVIDGSATVTSDIFALGLVALQLITKYARTAFAVEEGSGISLHHILDLYIPMLREKGNLVHASYGQPKESRKLTEMIVDCLKRDSQVNLKRFHKDLVLLSLTR